MNTNYLIIFGTRPEAIKLAPIINELKNRNIDHSVCNTGQHKELAKSVIDLFKIKLDFDLNVMEPNQTLTQLTVNIFNQLNPVFTKLNPQKVIVQGDTTTAVVSSLLAYYHKCDLYHVEAGLRTYDNYSPFPEEGNRKIISKIAKIHFTPTLLSHNNLINEGIDKKNIYMVGNTIVDSIETVLQDKIGIQKSLTYLNEIFGSFSHAKRLVVVTTHRRENFDTGLLDLSNAIKDISLRFEDVIFLLPVHPNPNVKNVIKSNLEGRKNIKVVPPLDYDLFISLLHYADFIVTDSGGIQEEATIIGKPLLIVRNTTERTEAIESGNGLLVGNKYIDIYNNIHLLLTDIKLKQSMSNKSNCFGSPGVSSSIITIIENEGK